MNASDRASRVATQLRDLLQGRLREHEPMAPFTTLRVGGPARLLAEVEAESELVAIGAACEAEQVPWTVVGRGSNLLVADAGFDGVVIVLGAAFRGVEILPNEVAGGEATVIAGASEPMPALARAVVEAGLGRLAWGGGVPGTVGGAVRMNAGAHGGEVRDTLVEADVLRLTSGSRETWPNATLGFSYRHCELPQDAVVLTAVFRLPVVELTQVRAELEQVLAWRREHQPLKQPNCGSVFTNPDGDSAGRLIESAGAKGLRIGGAEVSTMHANFIVTERGSSADDVRALIAEVQRRVAATHGVLLRPEVTLLGAFAHPDASG